MLTVTLALLLAAADGGAPASLPRSMFAPPAKPPPPADRGYELQRAKDGTGDLVYEGPGFTARIARDGSTRFVDRHLALKMAWSLFPFRPVPVPAGGPSLQSTFTDLLHHRAPRRGAPADADPPAAPLPLVPVMSPYRPDPKEVCTYPRPCYFDSAIVLIGVGGSFDLTDELMRLAGEDPYRQEKAHFLAATAALRGGLAAHAVAENAGRAAAELPAVLEGIACDEGRSVRERRATLEALLQELDGDTPEARAARASITRFIEVRFDARGVRCPAPR